MREFVTMSECPEEGCEQAPNEKLRKDCRAPVARLQDRNFAINTWKKGKKNQCPADAA
jgi:hypothetical protein